ncbi:hypothetical protein Droror1_Dr00026020 [Drosera rotundifolia]
MSGNRNHRLLHHTILILQSCQTPLSPFLPFQRFDPLSLAIGSISHEKGRFLNFHSPNLTILLFTVILLEIYRESRVAFLLRSEMAPHRPANARSRDTLQESPVEIWVED